MYNIHITARCGVFLWIVFEPARTRAGDGGWGEENQTYTITLRQKCSFFKKIYPQYYTHHYIHHHTHSIIFMYCKFIVNFIDVKTREKPKFCTDFS